MSNQEVIVAAPVPSEDAVARKVSSPPLELKLTAVRHLREYLETSFCGMSTVIFLRIQWRAVIARRSVIVGQSPRRFSPDGHGGRERIAYWDLQRQLRKLSRTRDRVLPRLDAVRLGIPALFLPRKKHKAGKRSAQEVGRRPPVPRARLDLLHTPTPAGPFCDQS